MSLVFLQDSFFAIYLLLNIDFMKNILKLVCAILPLAIVSCKKNTTQTFPKPYIAFKQGAGYISKDTTIDTFTRVTMGISASKYGDDILRTINFYCSYNDRPDSFLFGIPLYGISGDDFEYDCNLGTQKRGKEKFTITATTQSGASNSVSATVNIQ